MQLSFFSDTANLVFIIIIIGLLFLPFICYKLFHVHLSSIIFFWGIALLIGFNTYLNNYQNYGNFRYDVKTLSSLSVNINTFKKHENRFPIEKDFYLSSFLNNSTYFDIKDGLKVFNPLIDSDFKIVNKPKSLSFIFTKLYDKNSFMETGKDYRYCLSLPELFNSDEDKTFKNIKVFINNHEVDYKKETIESMREKDICHYRKTNSYTITFL